MQFSIITPTYKRPEQLARAIASVQAQSIDKWELIVVNDNPGGGTRESVQGIGDSRIIFLENEKNEGVNFSRNRGLDAIAQGSDWVIFLDDDDYLVTDALAQISEIISRRDEKWIVTARGVSATTPTTIAPTSATNYSYIWDYLIRRRFRGDATHCISATYIRGQRAHIRFPSLIRQAEEWLFYSELGIYTPFYYEATVTTLMDGYHTTGLNLRRRSFREQMQTIPLIIKEGRLRHLSHSPVFWLYVTMRYIRATIK